MEAGVYRLTKNVINPESDKRMRDDWRKAHVWKAGHTFYFVPDVTEGGRMALFGDSWGHHYVFDHSELWKAVAPHLEPADWTLERVLRRNKLAGGPSAQTMLRLLLDAGAVTLDALRRMPMHE